MVAITDGQLELRVGDAAALVVGDGTDYRLPVDLVQWWAAPEVRTYDQERSGAHGILPGRDLLGKHTTLLVVLLLADSEAEMGDRIDAWKAACASSSDATVTVRANLLGRTRRRVGRFRIPGEATVDQWALIQDGSLDGVCMRLLARGSAQFEALDPRTYGDLLHTASTGASTPGTGFTAPVVPPFTLGVGTTGIATISNDGNTPGPWTARIDGPLTGFAVSRVGTSERLSFSANGGLVLGAADFLALDSATRSVLLNGTADRRIQLSLDSSWWDLDPGANSFQLDADTGAGTLTVNAYDTWLS